MESSTFTEKPAQNILLVDDDASAIQLMGAILGNVATLRFATNGKDAMRLAHELAPDLILLDAEMPGMSGFELLGMLKAERQLADVPAIFITGHTEAGFEVSALEMGAADFIAKPFRSSLVLARVKTHLRMKRLADELRHAATTDSLTGVWKQAAFRRIARPRMAARPTLVGSAVAPAHRCGSFQAVQRPLRPSARRRLPTTGGAGPAIGLHAPRRPGGALRSGRSS